MIVFSGEAGIGKTAVLDAVLAEAERMGYGVGRSKAEEGSQIAPMAPLLLALRDGRSPLMSTNAFRDLASLRDEPIWLMDHITGAVEERAMRSPVLVAIDDLQWADRLTISSLRIMPPRLAGYPVVWVVTARHASPASDEVVASASSGLPVESIHLGPLDEDAIDELAYDRLGSRPEPHVRELLRAAEGNPFLAVELLDGLASNPSLQNGGSLPSQLITSVRNRLTTLPPEARSVLQIASVIGRSFSIAEAAAVLGLPMMHVLSSIEAAWRAGILEDGGDRATFRHDLLRQAVYEDLSPSLRDALHRAVADHLLAVGHSPLEAAPHILAGAPSGDHKSVETLREAAQKVVGAMPSVAADLIERAFALLPDGDPWRVDVGRQAVKTFLQARRGRDAVAIADKLLASPLEADLVAEIQAEAAWPLWQMGYVDQIRERAESTLRLDGLTERRRPTVLALNAMVLSRSGDPATALAAGELAEEEGRRVGDRDGQAIALYALAETATNDGRFEEALAHIRRLHSLRGVRERICDEAIILQMLDRYDESRALLEHAQGEVAKCSSIPIIDVGLAHLWHNYYLGRLDDAEADGVTLLRDGSDHYENSYEIEARVMLMRIAQLRGDLVTAYRHVQIAEEHLRTQDDAGALLLTIARARMADAEGDVSRGVALVRNAMGQGSTFRHRWRWTECWFLLAVRLSLAGGEPDLAKRAAASALTLAERNPHVATIVGIGEHCRGLVENDVDVLERVVRSLAESPRPLIRADALADYGWALIVDGQRDAGVAALDAAWDVYTSCGAQFEVQRVQGLLQSAGVRRRRWTTAPTRPSHGWDALTETEQRVAHLIAEGYTNRAAAEKLLSSPHTIATHFRSIFDKLGVSSRVQLTRMMMRMPN
jgi:DNA-binding CsgD family transcriptional regulator/tetratricopeptide (TPR) repeat protein